MSGRLRKLYARAPIIMQQAIFTAEGYRVSNARYGPGYQAAYEAALARLEWSHEDYSTYRDLRLQRYLDYVFLTVPAYKAEAAALGGSLSASVSAPAMLAQLPLTSKADIQTAPHLYRSSRQPQATVGVATGGSTGSPFRFHSHRSALQEQWAVWWRYRAIHGLSPSVDCGHFGGQAVVPANAAAPPYWRRNPALNLTYFSPNHLRPETARDYVAEINRRRLLWLHGYPSVLAALARHILDQRLELHDALTWVTTGAEGLTSEDRKVMTDAYGARVTQHYGLAEAVANFSECTRGRLHIDEDHAYVEFVPHGDGNFKIVGTALSNRATALLRYTTGDLAQPELEECGCGHPGRVVKALVGRESDFLRLESGELLGPVNQLAKWAPRVQTLQLIEHGGDRITARVVPSRGFTAADADELIRQIQKRVTAALTLDVQVAASPLRTAAGKALAIVPARSLLA